MTSSDIVYKFVAAIQIEPVVEQSSDPLAIRRHNKHCSTHKAILALSINELP